MLCKDILLLFQWWYARFNSCYCFFLVFFFLRGSFLRIAWSRAASFESTGFNWDDMYQLLLKWGHLGFLTSHFKLWMKLRIPDALSPPYLFHLRGFSFLVCTVPFHHHRAWVTTLICILRKACWDRVLAIIFISTELQ